MRREISNIAKWVPVCIACIQGGDIFAQHLPSGYIGGTPINFIRTWDATAPEQDVNTFLLRPLSDVKQTTLYMDGLGRPLQTVVKQGALKTGTAATDMVSPVEYDELGREQYKYLPYPDPSATNGSLKLNPFQAQQDFYKTSSNPSSPIAGQGETYFYSKANFEASPLGRITDTYAAGNSWVGSENNSNQGTRRNVQLKYDANTALDLVHIWTVNDNPVTGLLGTYTSGVNEIYPPGQLYKTITTDEQKKQVIEFKDKQGNLILKKLQLTAADDNGAGTDYTGWLSTYYIYDDYGNLRCVIQPEGVKAITSTWTLNSSLLDEQCFRYEYDQRNRVVLKKVPGAGEVYLIYDTRGRQVMMQDAGLRNTTSVKWMITKYDDMNRVIETGVWESNLSFTNHLAAAYNSVAYPSTTGNYELLTYAHYDDYTNLPSALGAYRSDWNSHFSATNNSQYPYPQMPSGDNAVKGMTTWTQAKILGTGTYQYAVIYYDDKGRLVQSQSSNITGGLDIMTTQYTWSGQPLINIMKQEKAGSPAQATVIATRYTYDDLGRMTKTEKKLSNTLVNANTMSAYRIISEQKYNVIGQLTEKKLAPAYGSSGLETLAYEYNIRGWLLGMNRDYAKDGNENNYFGFDLGYDKADNHIMGNQTYSYPQFNGNIEGTVWKSKGDKEKRRYDFSYDAANRLILADFNQYNGGGFNKLAAVDFSVKMGNGINGATAYDDNGNILQMQQMGLKINSSSSIDNMRYTYMPGSNKLKSVTDFDNDIATTMADFKTNISHPQSAVKTTLNASSSPSAFNNITDYSYDLNGNLVLDNNKGISAIDYNYLNLPAHIAVSGKGEINYTYDAKGNKIKKEVIETPTAANSNKTITTTTTYMSGFIYESKSISPADPSHPDYVDLLTLMPHEEGRVRFKPAVLDAGNTVIIPASMEFDYMIKDHLGNVRMLLTEEQQQDKYPIASMEDSKLVIEKNYYDITDSYIRKTDQNPLPGLPAYINNNNGIGNNPSDPSFEAGASKNLYRINGMENKTGLGITLKVMAGDKVNIFGNSFYNQAVTNNGDCSGCGLSALNLATIFLGAPGAGVSTAAHGAITPALVNSTAGYGITNIFQGMQNNQAATYTNRPRAFINYILFDEQFKYAGGGTSMVGAQGDLKPHHNDAQLQDIAVPKNGYIYVYCSNESSIDVFFDNLQVVQTRGAILEETHYYPFGLTMTGISSRAAGGIGNRNKYSGKELQSREFTDGGGLEEYDFGARFYDPQIGRWHAVDPLANRARRWSPYQYAYNNPMRYIDPDGMEVINADEKRLEKANDKFDEKKEKYHATGKEKRKEFKASHSGKQWRDFRNSRNEVKNATAAFNHTQAAIDNFKLVDPWKFKEANELKYTDKNGTEHNVDIVVSTGSLKDDNDGAQTGIGRITDVATGIIPNNKIYTTIDPKTSTTSNIFAHEIGHAFGLAADPVGYQGLQLAAGEKFNCQDPQNSNNSLAKPALDMQHRYDANVKAWKEFARTTVGPFF